jgi:hypothetical protein
MSGLDALWRNATKSQRYRAVAGGAMVVWAAALVADMHYLRARPEFKQKFPTIDDEAQASSLLWSSSSAAAAAAGGQQQEEQEPEWRAARRAREAAEAAGVASGSSSSSNQSGRPG